MNSATFHEDRRKGIGGSDAPIILGRSPWRSPLDLWAEKTGRIDPPDLDLPADALTGQEAEGFICQLLNDRTELSASQEVGQFVHRDLDWARCHPDGVASHGYREGRGIVECKLTSRPEQWADGPPLNYQIQVQHNLFVTGLEWGVFGVLIMGFGPPRLHTVEVERNHRFIDALMERECRFWDMVRSDTPPEITPATHAADSRALNLMFNRVGTKDPVSLPTQAHDWDEELQDIKALLKDLKARREFLENEFKICIGDHESGIMRDGTEYSWRQQTRKAYSVDEATYRVLRRHKPKGE